MDKKNHDLGKNTTFLLGSACIMYGELVLCMGKRSVYNEVAFVS